VRQKDQDLSDRHAVTENILPVMVFVDEMVSGAERHQVSVVCGRRDGNGPRTSDVGVA